MSSIPSIVCVFAFDGLSPVFSMRCSYSSPSPGVLTSYPTRRSSDLIIEQVHRSCGHGSGGFEARETKCCDHGGHRRADVSPNGEGVQLSQREFARGSKWHGKRGGGR